MYLRKAAETLARESCGEPWLLQPKIEDMETLEYRHAHAPSSQILLLGKSSIMARRHGLV